MRLSQIQGYFSDHMLALGFKEHPNGFARTNIPATLLDKTYCFELRETRVSKSSQQTQLFAMPVTLSVYFKDYRTDSDLRAYALGKADQIYEMILRPAQALLPGGFSIQPTGLRIDPVGAQNLASAIMGLDFTVSLFQTF